VGAFSAVLTNAVEFLSKRGSGKAENDLWGVVFCCLPSTSSSLSQSIYLDKTAYPRPLL
jgi:hypothetical protein